MTGTYDVDVVKPSPTRAVKAGVTVNENATTEIGSQPDELPDKGTLNGAVTDITGSRLQAMVSAGDQSPTIFYGTQSNGTTGEYSMRLLAANYAVFAGIR